RFQGVTKNVAAVALDVSHLSPGLPLDVVLDGQAVVNLPWPERARKELVLVRRGRRWLPTEGLPSRQKSPQRYGGFRSVFDRRALLVYGTRGNQEENDWSLTRARFDAESFLARGGGSFEVIPDVEFEPLKDRDRNVVVYGNADTNAAWPPLLSTSPVQVRRGRIRVGMRPELGDDLACLLLRPRPSSEQAVVAAVSGTGIVGMRATDRTPLFVSGLTLPDFLVFGADALTQGTAESRVTGIFGVDWRLDESQTAWRDVAL
ncbi:MAG: alpha/beta hydrolase, partial [Planctomycetota bacterium]